MLTINGTLGTGLYWRGGQILELGGPLAVLLSFLLVGLLAWAVMQCITEMLCIWPIPGALSMYISEFVDMELGIAVGVTYWFTYSVSFSALVATSAAELVFWPVVDDSKSFQGLVIYFAIPVFLIVVNYFSIGVRLLSSIFGNMADRVVDISTCGVVYRDTQDFVSCCYIRVSDYIEVHG